MSIAEKYSLCRYTGVVNPVSMTMTLTASLDEEKGGETRVPMCDEVFFFFLLSMQPTVQLFSAIHFSGRKGKQMN